MIPTEASYHILPFPMDPSLVWHRQSPSWVIFQRTQPTLSMESPDSLGLVACRREGGLTPSTMSCFPYKSSTDLWDSTDSSNSQTLPVAGFSHFSNAAQMSTVTWTCGSPVGDIPSWRGAAESAAPPRGRASESPSDISSERASGVFNEAGVGCEML